MEHLIFSEFACAAFLLLAGATRYRYLVLANTRPATPSSFMANRTRQFPAYFTSTVWAIYVTWLVIAPLNFIKWDRWSLDHWTSDLLGWIAIPILASALWLFWYSHRTIGHYWSIRVELKVEHRLVTEGPYRHIRHPLYSALFLGYIGTVLALQSWTLAAWFPAFAASYLLFAKEEEKVMARGFGETYRTYLRQTGMFVPKWKSERGPCR
jgi:protein-S-isoprenylcysteine O-methyltransferase Ste14